MLIKADQSCLIVIDVQERLVPAMQAPARVIRNTQTLMTAAKKLKIPILLTEQYPKGLGHIVPELRELAKAGTVIRKMHSGHISQILASRGSLLGWMRRKTAQ